MIKFDQAFYWTVETCLRRHEMSPARFGQRSLGDLRAGITDGTDTWWVRDGTTLPGDIAIVAIHSRPPGVRVSGAANHVLP